MPVPPYQHLKEFVRDVPDFPKPGILYRDITPLLNDPALMGEVLGGFAAEYRSAKVDVVAAAEARGFLFGLPLALELGVGFVPIRKPGKLPHETRSIVYDLEYGTDTLEIHADALEPNQRVLIVDDLLATGGTVAACCDLVEAAGAAVVACAFLIDLTFLGGAERLAPREVFSLIQY